MRKVHLRLPAAPGRRPISTGFVLLAVLGLVLPALSSPPVQAQVTGPSCPCSIWSDATTPAVPSENDPQAVEVGMKFRGDVDGYIHGLRFYKGSANTGRHVGNLWTATGVLLASAAFTDETPSGWQQVPFAAPVPIAAGTTYVASYHSDGGRYAVTPGYFNTSGSQNGPLRALASGEDGPNGVFRYGPSGFPDQAFSGNNYWVDVVFDTNAGARVAPLIDGVAATAIGTAGATITWTTNEAADGLVEYGPTTTYGSSSAVDSALVTSHSRTLVGLVPNSLYHYRVRSRDGEGNLATSADFAFTTAACPCTLWGAVTPPASPFDNGSAIELGVQFRPDLDGYATAVRLYKAAGDPGPHVGNLWTATGALLASAAFTDETPSGWQQVPFAAPVPVTAGATYVASYRSSAGRYVATGGYFAGDGVQSGPLRAPATGPAGGNGVFAVALGGVPTSTYNGTNYWVDVVFTTTVDTTPPDTTITDRPANPSNGAAATLAFSASEAGSTFTCSLDGVAFTACTSPVSYTGLAEGGHTFEVKATDPAGNADPTPASHAWTVDLAPPVLTLPAPITAEATGGAGAFVTYTASAADAVSGPVTASCAPASGSLFALGTTAVTCAAADASGNTATGGFAVTVRDSTAPTVGASGLPDGWSATGPVPVTINAADAVGLASVSYSLDGAPAVAAPASGTAASVGVPVSGDGAHTLSYAATDAAGNASAAATATVRIDTTPPAVAITVPVNGTVTNSATPALAAEAGDGAGSGPVSVQFERSSDGGRTYNREAAPDASPPYAVTAGPLADGTYSVRAIATDRAGNQTTSAAVTFTVDTVAPVLGAVQAGGIGDRTAVISWTSGEAADTTVEYGPTTAYGSLTTADPGLVTGHSQLLSGLMPNTHYHYRVRGRDAAGNAGFSSDFAFTTSQDLPPVVVATVAVGDTPRAVAVNPTSGRVYVANEAGNSVAVIDASANRVVATVPVGATPRGVAANPSTGRVYATNYNSNSVSVLDGATGAVVATVPVGVGPRGVAVNPTTGRVYVANAGSDSVSVIDASANRVAATVPVGTTPRGVAVNPATGRVYVTDYNQGSLWVVDGSTNRVIATVAIGSSPRGVAVNPATNRIYVANETGNSVSVLDGAANTVVATVAVGSDPFDVGVNPTTNTIYVANSGPDTVSVLDGTTNAVVATLTVGSDPWGLAVDAVTERVYVANRLSNNVSVIQD